MRRFFWLPLGLSAFLVLVALAGLVALSWRNFHRLQPVERHSLHIARIQDVELAIGDTLLKDLRGQRVEPAELDKLRDQVREVAALEGERHPNTSSRLNQIAQGIAPPGQVAVEPLFEALAQVRTVLAAERERHNDLLSDIAESTRTEWRLAVVLLMVVPLIGAAALVLLQRRIEQPLSDLQDLLTRLSGHEYRLIPEKDLEQTATLAKPAFYSYNELVSRLQELEDEHRDREHVLETRVREATEALLAQNRELSRAERLAAVGAVSAGLAHELRNPLAGIQLACSKLQQKLGDGEQSRRIAAVIAELKRVNHRLTEQVDAARHAPEPAVPMDIATIVTELLELLRYQVPPGFTLQTEVDQDVKCVLPVAGLRQVLLNLVLNAVQIQGDSGGVAVSGFREADQVVIRVSDDGPGFPEEILRAGIRPFATGRAGGTGLGLAMVRRFVHDIDGELQLENRSPHGAQVTLRLPCRLVSEPGVETDA
jgi:two-component system NtrC family sensor kinase